MLRRKPFGNWIALGLAVLAACTCGGGGTTTADGRLELDAKDGRVDFGRVRVGESAVAEVVLANTGSGALTLAVDRTALPGSIRLAGVPKQLDSGRTAKLVVTFAPTVEGVQEGRVVFHTDALEKPDVELAISGEGVRTQIVVTPPVVDFGVVAVGTRESRVLTVKNDGRIREGVALRPLPDGSPFVVGGDVVWLEPGTQAEVPVAFAPHVANPAGEVALLELLPCTGCATQTVELRGVGADSLVVPEPRDCLDFGSVTPGQVVTKSFLVRNLGMRDEQVLDAHLKDASAPFTSGATLPAALAGGAAVELPITFAPTRLVPFETKLVVSTTAPSALSFELCVRGAGGGPDVSVQPAAIDFGQVAIGVPRHRTVLVRNTGLGGPDGGTLVVSSARIVGDAQYQLAFPQPVELAPGTTTALDVVFAPTAEGVDTATLEIVTNDADRPLVSVPLTARGRRLAACQIQALPTSTLAFGRLSPGVSATLQWALRNAGTDDCLVDAVRLDPASAASFALPAIPADFVLAPGETFPSTVTYAPKGDETATGAIAYRISDPANPNRSIPLSGESGRGCVVVAPNEIDFAAVSPDCAANARELRIYNACNAGVRVQSVGFDASAAGAFSVTGVPASLPAAIPAGQQMLLHVGFRPHLAGLYSGVLSVKTDERPTALSVPVSGRGVPDAHQTDTYVQNGRPSVDVLFVIDTSGSMEDEQDLLAQNFRSFINYAVREGVDYQIGITTTDVTSGGEHGRFVPLSGLSGTILTPRTPDVENVFRSLIRLGTQGSGDEQGLAGMELALTQPNIAGWNAGFLRPDALLSVVVVSDEEDHSPQPAAYYADFVHNIKGATRSDQVTFSAICSSDPALDPPACVRYAEVARANGGIVTNIESTNWAADLQRLGTVAFGFKTRFSMSALPADPSAIEVRVNGTLIPPQTGGAVVWTYDATANVIDFDPLSAPEPGARLEIHYRVACG